jgi:hypothetical protein
MDKLPFKLSPAIEGKFTVVNTHLPTLHSRIGLIDFRTITLNQAEELEKLNCRYLKRVKPRRKREKL